jgi:hypothetical protein
MERSRGKLPRHSASASMPLGNGALYRVDWGLSASFMFAPMDDNVIHDNRRSSHTVSVSCLTRGQERRQNLWSKPRSLQSRR